MRKLTTLIENYFQRVEKYPTLRFILELTALTFLTKIIFIIIGGIIFTTLGVSTATDDTFEKEILQHGWIVAAVLISLFAAFETLTGQWLIIWLVSKIAKNIWIIVLASATVFSLLHVLPILIISVFPIGVILAWSFIIKRKIGKWQAFWVTTTIHTLHNLIVEFMVYLGTRSV